MEDLDWYSENMNSNRLLELLFTKWNLPSGRQVQVHPFGFGNWTFESCQWCPEERSSSSFHWLCDDAGIETDADVEEKVVPVDSGRSLPEKDAHPQPRLSPLRPPQRGLPALKDLGGEGTAPGRAS